MVDKIVKEINKEISIISDEIELKKEDMVIFDDINELMKRRVEIEYLKGYLEGLKYSLRIIGSHECACICKEEGEE